MTRIVVMIRTLVLIACVIVSLSSEAQSFMHYNYSISQGIPSSEVYDVMQDRDGFLWFATDNGVVRYDGHEFETFNANQGLSDPVVFGFYQDYKGRIWFRTFSGRLSYWEKGKIVEYKNNDLIAEQFQTYPFSIYVSPTDDLWLGGRYFLGKITDDDNLYRPSQIQSHLTCKAIGDTYLLSYSEMSTRIQTIAMDDKLFPVDIFETELSPATLHVIAIDDNRYLSANNQIFKYDGVRLTRVLVTPRQIISLSKDNVGNLWVGYLNGGLEKYNSWTLTDPIRYEFLNDKSVTKVLHDHEGGIWITTLENGIYYLPNPNIQIFDPGIVAKIRVVKSVGDAILIGDQSGNIYSMNPTTHKKVITQTFDGSILSIFQDSQNKLWIGTNQNTYLTDLDLKEKKIMQKWHSHAFSEEKDGTIWASGGTLLRRFNYEKEVQHLHERNKTARGLYTDDSLVYMAGRTGIFLSKKDGTIVQSNFKNLKVTSFFPLSTDRLMLITQGGGFIVLDKKTGAFSQFDSKKGFIADNIYSCLAMDSSVLLGTEKGLVKLSIASVLKDKPSFQLLSSRSGLSGERIDFLATTRDSILAFSEAGVSVIPKQTFSQLNNNPRFHLKSIKINRQLADTSSIKRLHFDENNIQLEFGFISFSNNQSIISRFRLSPSDPWSYSNGRVLEFYSLPPGSYALELEFSSNNTQWLSGLKGTPFTIEAPFWKIWYYQLSVVLILIMFLFFYFRSRLALIRQREQHLAVVNQNQQKLLQAEIQTTEKERTRIAKDLHDSVGTNMAALKMHVGHLLRKHNDPDAETIEIQLQSVIHEIKEIIYNLAPPGIERYGLFSIMKNLVEKLNRSSAVEINLSTYGTDIFDSSLNITILRITQELLSNSLKHANAKRITLHLNVFEERLNMIFEDNGVGFSLDSVNRGSGIHNIESRLDTLKGQLKFESGPFGVSYNIDIPRHQVATQSTKN